MQSNSADDLQKCLSIDRIRAYSSGDLSEGYAKLMWNIMLCESMYAVLHLVEVGLRNRIDSAIESEEGKWWFKTSRKISFTQWQQDIVAKADRDLSRKSATPTHGQFVAELPFGFWTAMFERGNERFMRNKLRSIFPNMPRSERFPTNIRKSLSEIRAFRNRVFHHERILHCNPGLHHETCQRLIEWMSKPLFDMAGAIDRYPDIYANGLAICKRHLKTPEHGSD